MKAEAILVNNFDCEIFQLLLDAHNKVMEAINSREEVLLAIERIERVKSEQIANWENAFQKEMAVQALSFSRMLLENELKRF